MLNAMSRSALPYIVGLLNIFGQSCSTDDMQPFGEGTSLPFTHMTFIYKCADPYHCRLAAIEAEADQQRYRIQFGTTPSTGSKPIVITEPGENGQPLQAALDSAARLVSQSPMIVPIPSRGTFTLMGDNAITIVRDGGEKTYRTLGLLPVDADLTIKCFQEQTDDVMSCPLKTLAKQFQADLKQGFYLEPIYLQ